ncbi:hypothetical protein PSPO01_01330 [Paraphaeosphaeria sporulosa]
MDCNGLWSDDEGAPSLDDAAPTGTMVAWRLLELSSHRPLHLLSISTLRSPIAALCHSRFRGVAPRQPSPRDISGRMARIAFDKHETACIPRKVSNRVHGGSLRLRNSLACREKASKFPGQGVPLCWTRLFLAPALPRAVRANEALAGA